MILAYSPDTRVATCLDALGRNLPEDVSCELIVLANGLQPGAVRALDGRFPGLVLETSRVNLGFAGGCNRAVRRASGKYLVFLNDDAEVEPGWLEALLETVSSDPRIGAVGSRILLSDGTLQEAGSIIWNDGATYGVGRGSPPGSTTYLYLRDVDYCSAASLLVRRDIWDELGGMDDGYHPAYYEDVDLCLGIKDRGYRVVVDPRSVIRHIEGASSDSHFRAFLNLRNRARLHQKWAAELADREPPPSTFETYDDGVRRAVLRASQNGHGW